MIIFTLPVRTRLSSVAPASMSSVIQRGCLGLTGVWYASQCGSAVLRMTQQAHVTIHVLMIVPAAASTSDSAHCQPKHEPSSTPKVEEHCQLCMGGIQRHIMKYSGTGKSRRQEPSLQSMDQVLLRCAYHNHHLSVFRVIVTSPTIRKPQEDQNQVLIHFYHPLPRIYPFMNLQRPYKEASSGQVF